MNDKSHVSKSLSAIGLLVLAFSLSGSTVNPADIYLPQLKNSDPDARIAALRELLTSLDSRIPEAMLALLSDEGNSIRRLAARAIGSRWWQIPKDKVDSYVKALQGNLKSEMDLEDEKNMAERAIGLLSQKYDSKMFSRSPNGRWVIYERRGFPCLIDTTTFTEELLGWSPSPPADRRTDPFLEMSPWFFGGNSPIGQDEALWHSTKEAVALSVSISRRATSVWIWEHKYGVQKLTRSELIKLLHPKGKIDEPNPITAEIKEWKGDDLLVRVNWGRDWKEKGNIVGDAVVAWNLETHQWREISERYRPGGE
ncbi:MAG TPA: HEAT repeat domain-containing protein [Chthoniobacterales bacterium]|nr:HEAT repeat domain-containing protein [Chthoniobacterales bacterium]